MAIAVRKMMDLPITGTNAGSKNLVDVAIINSDGNHVDPAVAGGGAQYTHGDTDATPTGTGIMFRDVAGGNSIRFVSEDDPLPVTFPPSSGGLTDAELRATPVPVSLSDVAYVDDADWTDNTSKHLLVGGVYQSVPHTVTDGDVTPFLADENGRLVTVAAVATSALPTGAATSAKQDTGNTSLATIAAAVATEMQCDIVGALPAGTNNIGDVDVLSLPALPAGNNNIGDVDIASIAAGDNNIGNVDIASIAAGDNNIGNVDVVTLPSIPAGTNNIGDVDVLTLPATPAGTNLIGKISVGMDASAAYDGTTALTPKYAVIDNATSGDNTLVAAVVGKKIRVLAGMLLASAAVTVRFESGAGGTALSGQMTVEAKSGFPIPYCPVGHFETASNTLLNLELSGAVSVDGWIVYVEV